MRLELAACLEPDRDAIQRAVRVEVGADAPADDQARAVAVRIECAADGVDAGVVLEVRPPDSPRRYRYALDWRAQPLDARPRLLGLAVAEAVDASRIELVAVPEPAPPRAAGPGDAPAAVRRESGWTLALVGEQRTFSARTGVELIGVGLVPSRRLSAHLRVATDVMVETATSLTPSGAVAVRSLSSAPRLAYRAGGRLHAELGVGARIGIVSMRGEALPDAPLVGVRQVRVWLGPAASAAIGAELTPGVALSASFELGVVASGATARDLGEPVAALGGAWTSFGFAAAIAL